MKILFLLILFLSSLEVYSQNESLNNSKYQFAKDVFKTKYKKEHFEKFPGKIEVSSSSIQYDEKTFVFDNIPGEFMEIFTSGIFYPNILTGNHIAQVKPQEEVATMTVKEKIFYNMMRTDSLRIGNINELTLINPNPKIKRFAFWLFTKGRANATECYFELENSKANDKTPISEFIKNSKLTFFYRGTLII